LAFGVALGFGRGERLGLVDGVGLGDGLGDGDAGDAASGAGSGSAAPTRQSGVRSDACAQAVPTPVLSAASTAAA
jgi:hypothetical protein